MSEFNKIRNIYISNLENREYPVLPAYYFYINHTSNSKVLSQREFEELFMKGTNESYNIISKRIKPPEMDIEKVLEILDDYYNVHELLDKEGKLIKIV